MYVNMEVGHPRGEDGKLEHAIVKKRAIDVDGNPIGVPNKNPILESRMNEVKYRIRSKECRFWSRLKIQ